MTITKEQKISKLLKSLGVSPKMKGYHYLKHAIDIESDYCGDVQKVTRRLYPQIANMFNVTPQSVERTIRQAIESGWLRCDIDSIREVFGDTISFEKGKPTNKEFITTVADYLNMSYQGE